MSMHRQSSSRNVGFCAHNARRFGRGFTLVELMISMTLGLLVLAAISTVLVNTGKTNREQTAMARMQENGRFAISRISADLRMAGAQYCSSFGSGTGSLAQGHRLRAFRILPSAAALPWGMPNRADLIPAPPAAEAVWLSPRFFLQGHECTNVAACAPALNVLGAAAPVVPAPGTGAGLRAAGADVLTVRYLAGNGVPLDPVAGSYSPTVPPNPQPPLTLTSATTAAPLNFQAGNLALVTDCRSAEIFAPASFGGTLITPAPGEILKKYSIALDPRVFNFTQDMRTVSYFLRVRADADGGAGISTLVRQQNGQVQEISDGVERMEFIYGVRIVLPPPPPPAVQNPIVNTHLLTAAQVQAGVSASGAALPCLPQPLGVAAPEPGCLWRQVESIDVSLLLNTVTNVATNDAEPFSFSAAVPPLVNAAPPALLPSGLPRGRMYRKEFRTRVNVRGLTY
jgi:type IV pilus assembly protein PilW